MSALASFLGAQLLADNRQPTTLVRGEGNPLFAGGGPEGLLHHLNFLQRIVQLPLRPLIDRRRDHGDEKLKRQRQHWSPSCPFRPADSSCASP
jgi:hypothetical protein